MGRKLRMTTRGAGPWMPKEILIANRIWYSYSQDKWAANKGIVPYIHHQKRLQIDDHVAEGLPQ